MLRETVLALSCAHFVHGCIMHVFIRAVLGAGLTLSGTDENRVLFAGPSNDASLTATCGAQPSFTTIDPASSEGPPTGKLRLQLRGVRITCAEAAASEPCVAHLPSWPALFYCSFTGDGGSITTGPVNAEREMDTMGDVNVAISTFLECPFPDGATDGFLGARFWSASSSQTIKISLTHFAPPGEAGAQELPFAESAPQSNREPQHLMRRPIAHPTLDVGSSTLVSRGFRAAIPSRSPASTRSRLRRRRHRPCHPVQPRHHSITARGGSW